MATEFGGNWLDFRRFDEHNAVDRERFPQFSNELRAAMFEEPIRFITDVVRNDRSVLDMLYGSHTFVNPMLAKHYGMPEVVRLGRRWVRIDNARDSISAAACFRWRRSSRRTRPACARAPSSAATGSHGACSAK